MKDERISVLHVLGDCRFGGALSWLEALLTEADHRRFRYGVIVRKGSEAERRLSRFPITVLAFKTSSNCPSLANFFRLARLISVFSPDIIQTHGAFGARIAALFTAPRAYLLLTKHCVFESRRSRNPMLARPLGALMRTFTHALIATADCAKTLLTHEGFPSSGILTIPNGVCERSAVAEKDLQALRVRYRLSPDFLTIGFCARLEKEKNPRFLISLAARLAKKGNHFRFLVIGDGNERKRMEKEIAEKELTDFFVFTGYLPNPTPALALADVQLNCSLLSETRSLSLLEGLSLGIPAVASDLAGNCELVRPLENGLLYPKGNVSRCASLLERLSEDRALLHSLSVGARKSYEKSFTATLMTRRCECFYRALAHHPEKKH